MAETSGEHTPAFLSSHVISFFNEEIMENFHVVQKIPKRIYTVLDPNVGGSSYLGIMSVYFEELYNTPFQRDTFTGASMIIVGVDIVSTNTYKDQKPAIRKHIEKLRLTIPWADL